MSTVSSTTVTRVITIRHEQDGDGDAIRRVNEEAFGSAVEADLVDELRDRGATALSLVAVDGDEVVGHALFTPAEIVSEQGSQKVVALGPMAVLPERQRQRIGGKLVYRGLEDLRKAQNDVVVVLGHPEYYTRFGFAPASKFGVKCTFDVADEVFMVMELRHGSCKPGTVRYQPEFDES